MNEQREHGLQQAAIVGDAMHSVNWITSGPSYMRRAAIASGTVAAIGFSPFADEGTIRSMSSFVDASTGQNGATMALAAVGTVFADRAIARRISARRQKTEYETLSEQRVTDMMPFGLTECHMTPDGLLDFVWTVPKLPEGSKGVRPLQLSEYSLYLSRAAAQVGADRAVIHLEVGHSPIDEAEVESHGLSVEKKKLTTYLTSLNYHDGPGETPNSYAHENDTSGCIFFDTVELSAYAEKLAEQKTKRLEEYAAALQDVAPDHSFLKQPQDDHRTPAEYVYARGRQLISPRLYRDEAIHSEDRTRRLRSSQRGELLRRGHRLHVRWTDQDGSLRGIESLRTALELAGEDLERVSQDPTMHPNKRQRALELLMIEESASILYNPDHVLAEAGLRTPAADMETAQQPSEVLATTFGLDRGRYLGRSIEFNARRFQRKLLVTAIGLVGVLGAQALLVRDGANNESSYARNQVAEVIVGTDDAIDDATNHAFDTIMATGKAVFGPPQAEQPQQDLATEQDYIRSFSMFSSVDLPPNRPLIELEAHGSADADGYWFTSRYENITHNRQDNEALIASNYEEEVAKAFEDAAVPLPYTQEATGSWISARILGEDMNLFAESDPFSTTNGKLYEYDVYRLPVKMGTYIRTLSIEGVDQDQLRLGQSPISQEQILYVHRAEKDGVMYIPDISEINYGLFPTVTGAQDYRGMPWIGEEGQGPMYSRDYFARDTIPLWERFTDIDPLGADDHEVSMAMLSHLQGFKYGLDPPVNKSNLLLGVEDTLATREGLCTTANFAYIVSSPENVVPMSGFLNRDRSLEHNGSGSAVISLNEAHMWSVDESGTVRDATPRVGSGEVSAFTEQDFSLPEEPFTVPDEVGYAILGSLVALEAGLMLAGSYKPVMNYVDRRRRKHAYNRLHEPSLQNAYRKINHQLFASLTSPLDRASQLPGRDVIESFLTRVTADDHSLSRRERKHVQRLQFATAKNPKR